MKNDILIYSKSNYGNIQWYVCAPHDAAISMLIGKKTISRMDAGCLITLGFNVIERYTGKPYNEVMD